MFPCKIIVGGSKITVRIPGLFHNKDKDIPFDKISEVSVDTPLVGFSTITFYTTGVGVVSAHGFTKSEVKEIKRLYEEGGEDESKEESESESSYPEQEEEDKPIHYKTDKEIHKEVERKIAEQDIETEDLESEREQTTSRKSRRVREDDNSEEDNRQALALNKQGLKAYNDAMDGNGDQDYQAAINYFEQALEKLPDDSVILNNLQKAQRFNFGKQGYAAYNKGDWQTAVKYFQDALDVEVKMDSNFMPGNAGFWDAFQEAKKQDREAGKRGDKKKKGP